MVDKQDKIYLAGHRGMVGSAIYQQLIEAGYQNIVVRTHAELDLNDQTSVRQFMEYERPNQVILAAAKVGGIHANNEYPAEFIYQNLMMEANVIHQAWQVGCKHLLFLGSSCIYPKFAEQPMRENELLTGVLESTNEPYAIAKIAGIKLCESYNRQYGVDYRSVMPTNLYGENDNFHLENSHVIPALIRKFHDAKVSNSPTVSVWGTGKAMREFLHVEDMAAACLHVMSLDKEQYQSCTEPMLSHLNVGTGKDVTVRELAETIQDVVGYQGQISWDSTKPDGTPRKLMDISKLKSLGWQPKIALKEGLDRTYQWFVEHQGQFKAQ
ncbi:MULTISPECIES: GDP-L-fucose synthase [Methylomonas]|uniref:GDP-L-fucose synthase n=2 Tax=Methylomonas TaxID=416 RepID=A0A140E5J4_9GAMM|nr:MULTISPECIES: GDP-L-fucose synthase [Methylomonas]AMK75668.1 GDP-fucose synthetase [Methylomonas denitrificans]OAH98335.1 GDP-fucose synthetase [Methylomonas methanica]TCV82506.1 GDP-L-fucose synthase [Methylomonas methanica]